MKNAESIFLACLVSQWVAEDNVFFDRCCKEGNPTPQPASLPKQTPSASLSQQGIGMLLRTSSSYHTATVDDNRR